MGNEIGHCDGLDVVVLGGLEPGDDVGSDSFHELI